MDVRRICAVAQEVGDHKDFAAKEKQSVLLLEAAARQGARLAVFPETINLYCGDGPNNPRMLSPADAAFDDLTPVKNLLNRARELKIALAFGVFIRERGELYNRMYLFGEDGSELGHYTKRNPTAEELADGVRPGPEQQPLMNWDGVLTGGAICFDTHFEEVFTSQRRDGARLILIPSLWDGGRWLPSFAFRYSLTLVVAYGAWSKIIHSDGRILAENGHRSEAVRFGHFPPLSIADVNFDTETFHICRNIDKLPAILAEYGSRLQYVPDEQNSVFHLTSLSHDFTIADLVRKFKLLPYQEYFQSYKHQKAVCMKQRENKTPQK